MGAIAAVGDVVGAAWLHGLERGALAVVAHALAAMAPGAQGALLVGVALLVVWRLPPWLLLVGTLLWALTRWASGG